MLPNLSNSSQCVKDPTAENNQFSQRGFQHAGQRQRSRARGARSSAAESAEQEQLNRFIGVTCAWHDSSLIHGKEEHEQPDVGTVMAAGRRQAARDGAGVVSSRRTWPKARGQQKQRCKWYGYFPTDRLTEKGRIVIRILFSDIRMFFRIPDTDSDTLFGYRIRIQYG